MSPDIPNPGKIIALILAAGKSERMGQSKLLLPFKEKTIVECVVEAIIKSNIPKILLILGGEAEKIKNQISSYPVETTCNPNYESGMLSSVQWGFKQIPDETDAAAVFLADCPAGFDRGSISHRQSLSSDFPSRPRTDDPATKAVLASSSGYGNNRQSLFIYDAARFSGVNGVDRWLDGQDGGVGNHAVGTDFDVAGWLCGMGGDRSA